MSEFWQATQAILGPLIKKPVLTEKLLKRPPVRFIQLIVQNLIKSTGFAEGLYTDEEISVVKMDKKQKITFLTRLVLLVRECSSEPCPAQVVKIAAGLEPENTNIMLQQLAKCAMNKDKIPWRKVVEKILQAEKRKNELPEPKQSVQKPVQQTEKVEPKKPEIKQPEQQRVEEHKKIVEERKPVEEKKPVQEKIEEKKIEAKKIVEERKVEEKKVVEEKRIEKQEPIKPPVKHEEPIVPKPDTAQPEITQPETKLQVSPTTLEHETNQAPERPPSGEVPDIQTIRRMSRPQTARRGPPKIQTNVRNVDQIETLETAAIEKPAGVIIEDEAGDKDEEDNIIIEQSAPVPIKKRESNDSKPQKAGSLVDKLIKQNIEQQLEKPEVHPSRRDVQPVKEEPQGIILKTHRKDGYKETTQNEMQKLRSDIQNIVKSIHPVGTTLEYLQEDIESMQKELAFWINESKEQKKQLEEEKRKTEQELKPYYAKLKDIESQTQDTIAKINSIKASILKGDMIIENLLRTVVQP